MKMNKTSPVQHLNYLDGLRAIAAIYVVLHHASMQVPRGHFHEPLLFSKLMRVFGYGHYAVTLFIMLSGFCLMLPVVKCGELRGGSATFFKRRAHRILPPYFSATVFSLLLIATVIGNKTGSLWDVSLPVTMRDVVLHIFLLQDIFVENSLKINGVFWSISVEWRIYFLFPLILLLWKKWGALPTLATTLILSYLGQFMLRYTSLNTNPWGVCIHYIGLFVMGMAACEVAFSTASNVDFRDKIAWNKFTALAFIFAGLIIYKVNWIPFYITDFFCGCLGFLPARFIIRKRNFFVFEYPVMATIGVYWLICI